MVSLPQLKAFVAVVDAGGFAAAADDRGVSQSAVSHAVAALEAEVGGIVIERARPWAPTPLGERLLPFARAAIESVAALEAVAGDATAQWSGEVRIAAAPTVCQGLLPALLCRWRSLLPGINMHVFEVERYAAGTETARSDSGPDGFSAVESTSTSTVVLSTVS